MIKKNKNYRASLWLVLFSGLVTSVSMLSMAKEIEVREPSIIEAVVPIPSYSRISSANAVILSQYHYGKIAIDDTLSLRIYESYLKVLDPQKVYFLEEDIKAFNQYALLFDDYLRRAELDIPFMMYNQLLMRMKSQGSIIQNMIDVPFDFKGSDTVLIDRKDSSYAKTEQELDGLWKERVKNELITIMLSDKKNTLEEAREKLKKRYKMRQERIAQNSSDDVFSIYMNAVAGSFDPHSSYMSYKTMENFNINMSLSLQGIGTVLRQDEESIKIMEIVPGGPADLTKQIAVADEIIGVAQGDDGEFLDIVGMRLDDVVEKIRGKKDTVVRLQILGNKGKGPEKIVRIVRDKVKLEQQAAKSSIKNIKDSDDEYKVGVITLPAFYSDFEESRKGSKDFRSTTRDIKKLLETMTTKDNIDGLVIDLRGNGGGSLEEVVNLSALFIDENKTVVQTKNYDGRINAQHSKDEKTLYNGPLIVIIDRLSASASEIFAGSMQDQGRALIVGSTSFGKGTVQTLVGLNSLLSKSEKPGQTKVTVAKFYRANGDSTQEKGVIPDLLLPSFYDTNEIGESTESYVLPWDQISASKDYIFNNTFEKSLPILSKLHDERLKMDPKLQIYKKQQESVLEAWKKKTLSLNLQTRKTEMEDKETEALARENSLRKLYNLPLLTLEQYKNEEGLYTELLKDNTPDVILDESVNIMKDLLDAMEKDSPAVLVEQKAG